NAVHDVHVPVPQFGVGGIAALESQVGVLSQPGKFSYIRSEIGAFPIVHGVTFSGQAADLAERTCAEVVDHQLEIECAQWIISLPGCHGSILLFSSRRRGLSTTRFVQSQTPPV